MYDVHTFKTGAHTALLDPANGAGILIAPNADEDVRLGSGQSLNEADWNGIIGPLVAAGWLPVADEWDVPVAFATLDNGRPVFGLFPAHYEGTEGPETDGPFFAALLALLDACDDSSVC